MTSRCLVALLAATSTFASTAHANGRYPAAQEVLVTPDGTNVALRATFGFVLSRDAGHAFHYVCEDALNYGAVGFLDPPYALDQSLRLHVGLTDGMVRASADRCTFTREAALEGADITDLDNTRDGTTVVVAARSSDGKSRVYASTDGGDTFAPLGDGVASVLFDTVEIARADPRRVYLTGVNTTTRTVAFYRSNDGGATLVPMTLMDGDEAEDAFVSGTASDSADTVYVRVRLLATLSPDGGGTSHPTALLRSTDGGQSWTELARSHGSMLGFAVADDGHTLFYGGPSSADGLMRSDDDGMTWQRVASVQVQCLRWAAGALYVCGNDASDGYALARSTDGGATLVPLLRLADIAGTFTCPASSPETTTCVDRWNAITRQYFAGANTIDAGAPMSDAGASLDAEATDAPRGAESSAGSHGCAVAPPGDPHDGRSPWLLVLALGAWIGFAAMRRSRRAARTLRV